MLQRAQVIGNTSPRGRRGPSRELEENEVDEESSVHSDLSTAAGSVNTEMTRTSVNTDITMKTSFTENISVYSQSWQGAGDDWTLADDEACDDDGFDLVEEEDGHGSTGSTGLYTYTSWVDDLKLVSKDTISVVSIYRGTDGKDSKSMENCVGDLQYRPKSIFPRHYLEHPSWNNEEKEDGQKVSSILLIPYRERSPEQVSFLCTWLMSRWPEAAKLGFLQCAEMLKVLKYMFFGAGEDIITEGDVGNTFFIIIQGECGVIKEASGLVTVLGAGKSFGELALFQEGQPRTATIRARSEVGCICLSREDYNRFIMELHRTEKRENFMAARLCSLFGAWKKESIEIIATNAKRRHYEAKETILIDGVLAETVCIILDGVVEEVKKVSIRNVNRLPVTMTERFSVSKKIVKNFVTKEMIKGEFFGDLSVVQKKPLTCSYRAKSKVSVLAIQRLELLAVLEKCRKPLAINTSEDDSMLYEVAEQVHLLHTYMQPNKRYFSNMKVNLCDRFRFDAISPLHRFVGDPSQRSSIRDE